MKKFLSVLCALLVLCFSLPALAAGNEQNLEDFGVSFDLPSDYDVFMPDDIDATLAQRHGLTVADVSSMFSYGMELVALPQDNSHIFAFLCMYDENFSHITNSMLSNETVVTMFEEMLGQMMGDSSGEVQHVIFGDKNYLLWNMNIEGSPCAVYLTVSDCYMYAYYTISMQSASSLPEDEAAFLDSVLNSAVYSTPTGTPSQSLSDEEDMEDLLSAGALEEDSQASSGLPVYVYILIVAAVLLVVVLIVLVLVLTGRQKKKQQAEVAALRQAVEDLQKTAAPASEKPAESEDSSLPKSPAPQEPASQPDPQQPSAPADEPASSSADDKTE